MPACKCCDCCCDTPPPPHRARTGKSTVGLSDETRNTCMHARMHSKRGHAVSDNPGSGGQPVAIAYLPIPNTSPCQCTLRVNPVSVSQHNCGQNLHPLQPVYSTAYLRITHAAQTHRLLAIVHGSWHGAQTCPTHLPATHCWRSQTPSMAPPRCLCPPLADRTFECDLRPVLSASVLSEAMRCDTKAGVPASKLRWRAHR